MKEKEWLPKPGDLVRNRMAPRFKMIVTRKANDAFTYGKTGAWVCRWLNNDGKFYQDAFVIQELEPWNDK